VFSLPAFLFLPEPHGARLRVLDAARRGGAEVLATGA